MATTKSKNPLGDDPTRTLTIRRKAVAEIKRKYTEIKRLINQSVVTNKIFTNVDPLQKSDFVFLRSDEKLQEFDRWLQTAINQIILTGNVNPRSPQLNWMLQYFLEGYERGAKKGNTQLARFLGRNKIPVTTSVLQNPFHIDKLQLLFSRDFTQLKGITEAMSQQINYVLSEGLLEGLGSKKIAKNINDRVDKIGITRSNLLARTEIINTFNLAVINEGNYISSIIDEQIVYEWVDSGDSRVRPTHVLRDGKYYTSQKVSELIGEPNCRCTVVATPISFVPDGKTVIR